ncbi:MAG: type II toxin-antitoxin system death-on-curing family toxin [Luteolibacter sp.]|uniref:type II toxin-antitoxin system death-on-curing family toxin n=1 Tax=Luteolibacter sp. TaxID=1962973 RepID=UPI003267DCA3
MSTVLKHPTVEAVLAIHEEVLNAHGGGSGLRSRELLESAVAAPQATMMGVPMISEPVEIAAAYFYYLCSNHAFVDGNKRVALATCLVFLSENGLLLGEELDVDAWESLTLAVAAGTLSRDEVTAALRGLLQQERD